MRYMLAVLAALAMPAVAQLQAQTNAITTSASPADGGTTSGGGQYQTGAQVTVSATTNACFAFVKWTSGGVTLSTNPVYQFTATKHEALVADFTPIKYTVTLQSQPPRAGVTAGGGVKVCGTTAHLRARALPGFQFQSWRASDGNQNTNPAFAWPVSENVTWVASFSDTQPPNLTVTPAPAKPTTNLLATVTGKASDNVAVDGVYYSLNGSGWTLAQPTNGWKTWSATVSLANGSNTVQVMAVDTSRNSSPVKTLHWVRQPVPSLFPVSSGQDITHPQAQLAFDGSNYLVAFQSHLSGSGTPTAQLLSPTGAMVGTPVQVPVQGGADPPAIAFDGQNYLLAWADPNNQTEGGGVHGQFVDTSGNLLGTRFQISQSSTVDNFSWMAFGAGVYFLLWADSVNAPGPDAIYGAMLDTNGNLVVPDFQISSSGTTRNIGQSAVAFDGTNFLATWDSASGSSAISGALISPSGNIVAGPFTIYTNSALQTPVQCVAFDGTKYLVVFNAGIGTSSPSAYHILGRFVGTDGTVLPDLLTISEGAGPQIIPGAAFDGTHYLVTWNQGLNPASTAVSSGINGIFLDSNGHPTGPSFPVFEPQGLLRPVSASALFDGQQYVVAAGLGQRISGSEKLQFTNGVVSAAFLSP